MVFRAVRVPGGARGLPQGPASVRYDTSLPWTWITAGHPRDWCQRCTRAWFGGIYQVKHIDAMCEKHGSWARHG